MARRHNALVTSLFVAVALGATATLLAGSAFASRPVRTAPTPQCHSERVEVLWGDRWWVADVIGVRKGFEKVHYVGWASSWDEWVPTADTVRCGTDQATKAAVQKEAAAALKALGPRVPGRRVEVLWGGSWWQAVEYGTRNGLVEVHYLGWAQPYDQWIEPQRIRAAASILTKAPRRGASVQVSWGGTWWDATILRRTTTKYGKRFKIHYTGWGSEWDEWVDLSRLRGPASVLTEAPTVADTSGRVR